MLALPDVQGTDFYPLWYGAKLVLQGENPYSESSRLLFSQSWTTAQNTDVAATIAYPIPFLLLITPLALMPIAIASSIWLAMLMSTVVCFAKTFKLNNLLLIPLFYPVFHCILIKNSEIAWFALTCLTINGVKNKRVLLTAICCALLPLKPQAGIIVSLFALFELKEHRKLFWTIVALIAVLMAALSFLLQPLWLSSWIETVLYYKFAISRVEFFPWTIILIVPFIRAPWYVKACVLQLVIFDINDLYRTVHLLPALAYLGGPAAFIAASLSWLSAIIYEHPNNSHAIWFFCVTPTLILGSYNFLIKKNKAKVVFDKQEA